MAAYDEYEQQRQKSINEMYDAQKQNTITELESAYQQNRAAQEQAAQQIEPTYNDRANQLAGEYERSRRNLNAQANANGLNTGTASQMALAQNSAYQGRMGALRTSQAEAETAAQRQAAELEAAYKNAVASAISQNDFNRAKALYDEYNNAQSRAESRAATLAKYGDFSGYGDIYGGDSAAYMQSIWNAQNPDLAYQTGRISAQEFKGITGSYPAGYSSVGSYTPPVKSPATTVGTSYADTLTAENYDNAVKRQAAAMMQSGVDRETAFAKAAEDVYKNMMG